jgi:hypothetical protein
MPHFGGSPFGEAAKTGVIYKKNQYVPRLTEERMALYSLINRGMYEHMVGVRGEGVPSRNIFHYIRWLDVTTEYKFVFLSTDECMGIYSPELYSSVTSSIN